MNLFVRVHGKKFTDQTIPWFLPPNCGGMGLEPPEIPVWGYKYINYILEVLKIEDWRVRTALLWKLKRCSDRLHHGVSPTGNSLIRAIRSLDTIEFSTVPFDKSRKDLIFSVENIVNHMLAQGIPNAELTTSYTWDDIKTYAYENNFVPVNDIVELFDRIDCFQQMLVNPEKIARRTIVSWSRKSSKFWKKTGSTLRFDATLDVTYTGLKDLERRVNEHVAGFASIDLAEDLNLYGPSLIVKPDTSEVSKFSALMSRWPMPP